MTEHWSLDSQAHKTSPIIINISFAPNKSLVQWYGTTEEKTRLHLEFCLKWRRALRPHMSFTVQWNCSESFSKYLSNKLTCTFNISYPLENCTSFWAMWLFDFVTRVYVPRFFVSSRQRFGATDIKALGVTALGSWTNRATALRQISVTAPFYLEDSRRERERKKRVHAHRRGSPWESALAPPFICFSSTWACPMQIGLSQECCFFCLKSSLWSLDLPLTFLVF